MLIDLKIVLGGVLLGFAAGMLLLVRGKILGCSGILFHSWDLKTYKPNKDNLLFLGGLFLSGIIFNYTQDVPNPTAIFKANYWLIFFGGVLVGGGTFLGSGCTSGHGLCGLSLLRKRSMVAVGIFFSVGIITAWLVH